MDALGAQNEFGLFNMIGNVWEWTGDKFARYHTHEPRDDPAGSPRGTERVKKGGSFLSDTEHSYRNSSRLFLFVIWRDDWLILTLARKMTIKITIIRKG